MMSSSKPVLLVCYDHFFPAYKAGGPIQSLTNLVLRLQNDYQIFVLTSAFDLNESNTLPGIELNAWVQVSLPNSSAKINVWYADRGRPSVGEVKQIIAGINPACIYLNGMFSFRFVIIPLIARNKNKVVICPRGMLQKGALAGKSFKKKLYLAALKLSGLCRNIIWHATDAEEKADIRHIFGSSPAVYIAGNIPRPPVMGISQTNKSTGALRLVYLSLISAKKNLLQLLKVIAGMGAGISLDIYGPVKDEQYWKLCRELIETNDKKISYKGDVVPAAVQDVFSRYDASILLTKGENFGHALYESLSAGRPVITSNFTPWKDMEEKGAGWNVDISDEKKIEAVLNKICNMPKENFDKYCIGAYDMACEYFRQSTEITLYKEMFSGNVAAKNM